MRDRDRICSWITRVPGAGRVAAFATVSAVAAAVALVGVGGASAHTGLGGLRTGSRSLPAYAFRRAGLPGVRWALIPSPGHDSALAGVACVKASDCWAVGESQRGSSAPELNQALRFNGKKWSKVKRPHPGGTASGDRSELFGVTCVSASDCWAVGESQRGSSAPELNQALRFNGKRWSKVTTPHPGGTGSGDLNELWSVACVSASNCWAVGDTQQGDSAAKLNQALRFNGKRWSSVKEVVSRTRPAAEQDPF
jgi:hypothetical protein